MDIDDTVGHARELDMAVDETPFDEQWYLSTYSDIAEAVRRGGFPSGRYHYLLHGRTEGRQPLPPRRAAERPPEAAAIPFGAHNKQNFLAPIDLQLSAVRLRKVALIGSCSMAQWGFHNANPSGCPGDLILVNNGAQLPELTPEAIDSYDFALIHVPLRTVVFDNLVWHIPYADQAAHQDAFERACANLEYQLGTWMQWNHERGLLTFVINFQVPQHNAMGRLLPKFHLSNPEYFIGRLNEHLETVVRRNKNAYVLDLDRISASIGRRYIQDDSVSVLSHNGPMGHSAPVTTRIEPMAPLQDHYEIIQTHLWSNIVWSELMAMYRTIHQIDPVKVVVVDLDDTLWNGISGDMQEFSGGMAEGWPIGFVESLIYLKKRGILLAIASKNEESRIREIWPKIFGKRLLLDDFAAIRINWQPKTDNVRDILQGMNLLPRNALFIDDNPAERQAMKTAFPEMRILGRYPFWLKRTLLWSPETQVAVVTGESGRRTEMIQAQFVRETNRREMSREQFLHDAAPVITMLSIHGTAHPRFDRVFELINKTNQFNTTGRRWRLEEIEAFFQSGGRLTAFEVTDRFTSYGLVGVVLLRAANVEQWVMSCRVLGYQIEDAVMANVVAAMRAAGATAVTGQLIKTDVNFPCRELFSKCGFDDPSSTGHWVLDPSRLIETPEHVTINQS